jgi:23S rRNA (cytidine1920-2'-O)/16S rRNA (cytidine1409-2'-O)-methyltransferase
MARPRFRPLRIRLAADHPELTDPERLIEAARVLVDGRYVTNPNSLVPAAAAVVVLPPSDLRGEAKLGYALDRCAVPVDGAVALDIGAAAGGFTSALLARGARKVFAVDAGHGQLLGSLRQDARVVNLEATNLGALTRTLVPEPVEIVTVDVSYLPLRSAVAQLAPLEIPAGAHLMGLVKPMFELGLAALPGDEASLDEAVRLAGEGIAEAGWLVCDTFPSAVTGSRGALEFFVHATAGSPFAEVGAGP